MTSDVFDCVYQQLVKDVLYLNSLIQERKFAVHLQLSRSQLANELNKGTHNSIRFEPNISLISQYFRL